MLLDNQKKIIVPSKIGPKHVAIIMDGNGRWAKNRGKLRVFGHQAGVKAVQQAVGFAVRYQLDALTLYAFSSENWNRPAKEVKALMELFILVLNSEIKGLHKYGVRLRIIGDISRFSPRLQEQIYRSEQLTKNNPGLMLNIAANYGGRWDIVKSFRQLAKQAQEGTLRPDTINEDLLSRTLCLGDQTPVDLVIRTGGEHRISNFLLWQIAYAELYFTDVLWPDFNEDDFENAMHRFAQRERRFGGTTFSDAEAA
ncbi:MAG: (2E,6E)-farnesyl-diphosphate-specific ditrans,polycis-undecaprenyl-diphosphate synthase [Candidatus Malihini olakiniferum]